LYNKEVIRQKLLETLSRHRMVSRGDRVCVAISGGPDSTALLLALDSLKTGLGIVLSACHINHGLRGTESDGDELFARETAERLSIPFAAVKIGLEKYRRITGGSVQSAARELRYLVFKRLIRGGGTDKIATAHTADDNAETFLLNLLRGAGPRGLSGIPPVREGIFIRPFIETGKADILRFLAEQKAAYREDSSNASPKYLRNRIRNELLPVIEREFNPSVRATLGRTAEIFGDVREFMAQQAAATMPGIVLQSGKGGMEIDCRKLAALHPALRREAIRCAMADVRGTLEGISFENMESILRLTADGGAGAISLRGISVSAAHGILHFSKMPFTAAADFSIPFVREGTVTIGETGCCVTAEKADAPPPAFDRKCETVHVDADAIPDGAVLRNRRDGDVFTPLGAPGSRKLKKFFIDEKVPRWERDSEILLAHGNEALWIAGMRLSERVRITPQTRNILRIRLTR